MKETLRKYVREALHAAREEGHLSFVTDPDIIIEEPKDKKMGDFATTVAMLLAKSERKNPRAIAQTVCSLLLERGDMISAVEVAGPGFLNFRLSRGFFRDRLREVAALAQDFGKCQAKAAKKVLVEFVSANPTGPLHVGHGRGAAVGHSLANLLRWAGHDVTTEYYINDVGNQMNNLGRSTWLRYRELLGESVDFPEDLYQGEYIRDIARQVIAKDGDRHLQAEEEEALRFFRRITSDTILRGIREDLAAFRVEYDHWFSEQSLHDEGAVEEAIQWLREKDHVYDKDGAVWLRASAFQDEKDRVIIKQGGEKTYFCADIAYHKNKIDRGFDWILDLWGADHHGYVPRMNAVLEMMGYGKDRFEVLLVQFVTLKRGGEKVSMSTRSGEFVTLAEVVSEVGVDAARYFFMMRSADSHLDFDLELAKKETPENPVYYIQYAHARICNVFGTARDKGVSLPDPGAVALDSLEEEEEMALIKKILGFPEVIEKSAESLEVHRISFYLHDLAARFHAYYNRHRVVTDDLELTHARLVLLECLRRVFANGLSIIGVSAPEKM